MTSLFFSYREIKSGMLSCTIILTQPTLREVALRLLRFHLVADVAERAK